MDRRQSTIGLGTALLVCFGAAALGNRFTAPALPGWYAGLRKPSWNPPNWVFGPVWSLLYAAMAIAAWRVWEQRAGDWRAAPLRPFAAQLALNVGWSALFFGARQPGLAFGEILVLWGAIASTLVAFWRTSWPAGVLLVPYLGWVTFASALNFAIWRANR